jgi:hypothetical protein
MGIKAEKYADRMASCLRCFADRDAELAKRAVAKQMDRLEKAEPAVQLRALGRLGDLPAFWASVADPVRALFNARIDKIGKAIRLGSLKPEEAKAIALVTQPELRAGLPALAPAFASLSVGNRAQVVARRPDPYFVPYLADLLKGAESFDEGEYIAQNAVLPCAGYLTLAQLEEVLQQWLDNNQCWGRAMPAYLVELFRLTSHLGPERDALWRHVLTEVREVERFYEAISSGIGFTADKESE